ncbi:MAG: FAD-dependent oxidoreductase [Verrucomicrobiota bacterium]
MSLAITSAPKRQTYSRGRKFPKGSRLVVIGNGMVGQKFCESLVEKGLHQKLEVTVIGEEPRPAYDRIRLSTYVDHEDADQLTLKPASWYEENQLKLLVSTRVESIDRDLSALRLSDGQSLNYDALILATGSRPFVPPIPGIGHPSVFVYRTIEDLETIIAAAKGKSSAVVIGGGLLGLEAAQAVQKLGLQATVVERAQFLMPQQLNEAASGILLREIEAQDIEVLTGRNTDSITENSGKLTLNFDDGETVETDMIIVSAGIVPNSELADEADLPVGARGGVVVDDQLETMDDRIFAIGECALHGGRVYGLAAPGYAMARHVANRIAGKKTPSFLKPDLSTRLKMLGVDVVTIGDPLEKGRVIEFQDEGIYRMLTVSPRHELKGGLAVGSWDEAGKVQSLFLEGAILRDPEIARFKEEGRLKDQESATSVAQLPDDRIICNCMSVCKKEIVACLKTGPEEVVAKTGATTVCGSCKPLVDQLAGSAAVHEKPIAVRSLFAASTLAVVAVIATILAPPVAMAQSVESWWYSVDQFWRDSVIKQITGYSLLGLVLLGLLLSLRKRFRWFRLGHFARWRFFHAAFGLTALVALFVHTGFRFGHNLNFWLMFTFVGLNLLGAVSGMVAAVESSGTSVAALTARRFRPVLTYAHLVLFWPLPVLLTFHILSVYLY